MKSDHLPRHVALLLFAVVVLAWGFNWPVTKLIVHSISPLWTVAFRSLIATVVLLGLLWGQGKLIMPRRGDLPIVFGIALPHMVAFSTLVAIGIQFVPAGRAIVLGYTWRRTGWTMKHYVIEIVGRVASEADLERAQNAADARLAELETSDPARHGLGFLILHLGENSDYLLVETWTDQDILSHVNYGAAKGGKYRSDWPGPGACVWELAVMCHERESWLRHMLRTDGDPDPVAWEADLLDATL